MKEKLLKVSITLVIVAITALNVNISLKSEGTSFLTLNGVYNALAGENDDVFLAWGASHSCDGWFCPNGGSYHECEKNATGNECSTLGDRTCTCGSNCNPCS